MKTKFESNSFEGMRVIAEYDVGDQRIIVLERSNSTQEAVTRRKTSAPARPTPKIAARPAAFSASGPRPRGALNISGAGP
jgi:hypothetical protein